jgi:hypothetical protein
MVVQGFALLVGIFPALWGVGRWVKVWSFLVSFWCLVYFVITSFMFMHEGLC